MSKVEPHGRGLDLLAELDSHITTKENGSEFAVGEGKDQGEHDQSQENSQFGAETLRAGKMEGDWLAKKVQIKDKLFKF